MPVRREALIPPRPERKRCGAGAGGSSDGWGCGWEAGSSWALRCGVGG